MNGIGKSPWKLNATEGSGLNIQVPVKAGMRKCD